jgi:16S rRNA processing protein RimM
LPESQQTVRVGRVTAPFGIKGAVKVEPLTDFDDRFQTGAELWLEGYRHRVEWSKRSGAALIVKLAGVGDRTRAELLRGRYLEVPAEAAHPLEEGAWYHHQLIGLQVRTESGRPLGELSLVLNRPANDVWVVQGEGGEEQLVPATRDAVRRVDLETGEVVVADWLLEVEEA